MKKYYAALVVIFLLSGGAIALNISLAQGPTRDNARVQDISDLDDAVEAYANKNDALPSALSDVTVSADLKSRLANYEYKKGTNGKYQLCTTFVTDTTKSASSALLSRSSATNDNPDVHTKGIACFDFTAYNLSYRSSSSSSSYLPQTTSYYNTVCASSISSSYTGDTGTISKVDTAAGTITTDTGSYRWTLPPSAKLVYDANCKVSTVAALKVGAEVEIYHNSAGLIQVMQLQ